MKIYLAGPFFNPKQIETISRIEKEFDKYGFDYFSPRKSGGVISHLSPENRTKESKRIYDSNVSAMIDANILFANGTLIALSFFKNSIGPISETFFPGKNFKVSGFGVYSVSTIIK